MATTYNYFKCIYHRDQIMMRYFTIILLFILPITTCLAQQHKLVKCLAQEEAYFHKIKQVDAFSKLNQSFVNFLTEVTIKIDKIAASEICRPKKDEYISVKLLHYMILKNSKKDLYQKKHAIKLFFNFITDLQSVPKAPSCLEKNIPELAALMKNFRHLEENLSVNQLLQNKKDIRNIFKQLKKYKEIFKYCDT